MEGEIELGRALLGAIPEASTPRQLVASCLSRRCGREKNPA